MKRQLTMMTLLVMTVSLFVAATEWEEIGGMANIVSDYETGLPAIIFNAGLAYDEVPEMMQLHIVWEVFSIAGGTETMLYEYSKTTRRRAAASSLFSASQSVLIEPGVQYGARVWIEDLENDLAFERAYSYFAPKTLAVGLRFVGWDGTEEADLAAMPNEELEELVRLQKAIASYEMIAEEVSVADLFSQYAVADEDYPVAVILLPDTGVNNNWGSESEPITVTFGLTVTVFSIPSANGGMGFQDQLALYEQEFVGTVYEGSEGDEFGDGAVVFVHDAMRVMLDAAVAEQAARSE